MAFLLSGRLTPEERHPEGEVARLAAVAFGTSLQLDAPWAISALIQIRLFHAMAAPRILGLTEIA
jgi:hypothetical protein